MPSSGVQTCARSEEHTSELQSHDNLVCRLLLEKKKKNTRARGVRGDVGGRVGHGGARVRASSPLDGVAPRRRHVPIYLAFRYFLFFFNDTATTEIYTLSLHDALPI